VDGIGAMAESLVGQLRQPRQLGVDAPHLACYRPDGPSGLLDMTSNLSVPVDAI
jgi:hypothetical protein